MSLLDRCAIVVILLCVGQIIFALTGKIGFANDHIYKINPFPKKYFIDWGRSFWTIMEWIKIPPTDEAQVLMAKYNLIKVSVLLAMFLTIATATIIIWAIAIKRKKVNLAYLLLPLLNIAPIIFESNYHSAYYIIAPCQIYSIIVMAIEMGLATYVLIEEKKLQRKGR